MLFGYTIATYKIPFLIFEAILLIGFFSLLRLNFITKPQGKSGWIILAASFIFLPTAFCLGALTLPFLLL